MNSFIAFVCIYIELMMSFSFSYSYGYSSQGTGLFHFSRGRLFSILCCPGWAGHNWSFLADFDAHTVERRSLTFDLFCVWLVPDVAVEDFPEDVEDANNHRHHTEEDDSS